MNTCKSSDGPIGYAGAPATCAGSETGFSIRIAVFNSLGFMYSAASVTFLDARFTSHVFYPPRTYPLGYWICLSGPVIFAFTYLCLSNCKTTYGKILSPALILVAAGALSLWNFRPEVPHLGITLATMILALTSIVSSWIRFEPIAADYLQKPDIPWELKIKKLKESITLWRTLAVGLTFGYIA